MSEYSVYDYPERQGLMKQAVVAYIFLVLFILFMLIYLFYQLFFNRMISKRAGSITETPVMPFETQSLTQFEGVNGTRFYVGYHRRTMNPYFIQRLYSLMEAAECHDTIPHGVRVISIKMDGFKCGNYCHQFIPVHRQLQSGSYKYQMFGNDKIQATFYMENDIPYIAGICIYVESHNQLCMDYERGVIEDLMKYPKYQRRIQGFRQIPRIECRESNVIDSVPSEKWNVQFCNRIERDLMTTSLNEVVYHK